MKTLRCPPQASSPRDQGACPPPKHPLVGNPRPSDNPAAILQMIAQLFGPNLSVCLTLLFVVIFGFEHPSLTAVVCNTAVKTGLSCYCQEFLSRESVGYRIIQRTSAVSSSDFL